LREKRISEGSDMVLDAKGRVSWVNRDDDDLSDDRGRWSLWFGARDGFPQGNGEYNGETMPLPITENGAAMGSWVDASGRNSAWTSEDDWQRAKRRAIEIREQYASPEEKPKEEFAPPEPVAL